MSDLSVFISKSEKREIINSIREAEKNTSGEVRVHFENQCEKDPYQRAVEVFNLLNMHSTLLSNAVLVYIAIKDRKFAIIGDSGINNSVPKDFWESIKDGMNQHFTKNEICKGICLAVVETGRKLKEYYPFKSDDINELDDEISYFDN